MDIVLTYLIRVKSLHMMMRLWDVVIMMIDLTMLKNLGSLIVELVLWVHCFLSLIVNRDGHMLLLRDVMRWILISSLV